MVGAPPLLQFFFLIFFSTQLSFQWLVKSAFYSAFYDFLDGESAWLNDVPP